MKPFRAAPTLRDILGFRLPGSFVFVVVYLKYYFFVWESEYLAIFQGFWMYRGSLPRAPAIAVKSSNPRTILLYKFGQNEFCCLFRQHLLSQQSRLGFLGRRVVCCVERTGCRQSVLRLLLLLLLLSLLLLLLLPYVEHGGSLFY